MIKTWWTVFAVHEDTQEGLVAHVQAEDVASAKDRAYREAEGIILIAGVIPGKVNEAKESTDVTPLRGRGHAIVVRSVHVAMRKLALPSRCPHCRADLRKAKAIGQTDLVTSIWTGHLTKTGDTVSPERDHTVTTGGLAIHEAVRIWCTTCSRKLWDGVRKEA